MRRPVLAAHHASRAVSDSVARRVSDTVVIRLNGELEVTTRTARILTVTPRIRAELVALKEHREANFDDFHGAEFEATC